MSQPEPATVASTAPASGNPGGHSGANPATAKFVDISASGTAAALTAWAN
jgi:hypothetical protein